MALSARLGRRASGRSSSSVSRREGASPGSAFFCGTRFIPPDDATPRAPGARGGLPPVETASPPIGPRSALSLGLAASSRSSSSRSKKSRGRGLSPSRASRLTLGLAEGESEAARTNLSAASAVGDRGEETASEGSPSEGSPHASLSRGGDDILCGAHRRSGARTNAASKKRTKFSCFVRR
jgi:hypothetical protein